MMPMVFRTLEEVDYIGEKLEPLLEKRLEAKGFVALFWSDTGWVRFFSKDPVVGPDDLRKTKLFVGAGNAAEVDLYRSVRLNPVPLETVDILPNLETGLINAVPLPPSYALAGQVDRAAPNMLDLAWTPLVGALVISKKTWDAIAPETREAMKQTALEAGTRIKAEGRRESVESVEAMRKRGLVINPLTAKAEEQWRREMETVYHKIRGTIVPADIFDEVTNQLAMHRGGQAVK
jgi:TRAP-type C4-dicarboxylate transport system substrate-binding protein